MIKNRPRHNFKTGIVSLSSELLHNVGYWRSSRPFHAQNHSASSGHGMMVDVTVFIAIASAPARRYVIPEALLCADHRSTSEPAIDRYELPIRIFGNRAQSQGAGPPSSWLLHLAPGAQGLPRGSDKPSHKPVWFGERSWPRPPPHRNDRRR